MKVVVICDPKKNPIVTTVSHDEPAAWQKASTMTGLNSSKLVTLKYSAKVLDAVEPKQKAAKETTKPE